MHAGIKAKQNAVREAKQAEEAARHQTDMNRRGGHDEVVFPTSTLDIPAAEKEIARLQVPFPADNEFEPLEPSGRLRALRLQQYKFQDRPSGRCSRV